MTTVTLRSVKGSNLTATEVDTNFTNCKTDIESNQAAITVSPINSQVAAYTLVLGDKGGTIFHPASDTTARIFTIPANSAVAYPVGTVIGFENDVGAGAVTIAITTDTLVQAGSAGTTGSYTLGTGQTAVIKKVTATRWRLMATADATGGGNAQTANPLSQFAATTSAQLIGVISDETGSGSLVFATSPTLVTPILGTPTSCTLTNATGLPVSTGISGLATGIATFLATPSAANFEAAITDLGNLVGYSAINSQSAAYTFILTDAGKTILHPAADTTARTFTVPANASVAYRVGTTIKVRNQNSAGVVTIAITTDTMTLVGATGSTGSRTLAAGGIAILQKETATTWSISGSAELT